MNQVNSVPYIYDNNGNQTSKTENSQTTNYDYNYENKLTTITYPSGDKSTYKYYGDGKRYEAQSSTASTALRYIYDGANIFYEYEATGSTISRYTMGLGIDEPISIYKNSVTSYYHFDGLGSVTKMTNSSQGVINSYTYDAWGEQVSRTVTLSQPLTYTSREYDQTADLYFYRARWYDYKTGRFLARDLLEGDVQHPLSQNRYLYTRNNPVNRKDPMGNWCVPYWWHTDKTTNKGSWELVDVEVGAGIRSHSYYCVWEREIETEFVKTTYLLCYEKCKGFYPDTKTKTWTEPGDPQRKRTGSVSAGGWENAMHLCEEMGPPAD